MGQSDRGTSVEGMQWSVGLLSWGGVGESMRSLMFPFCLFACEQVPPEGNPLKPVSIAAVAPVGEDGPEPATATAVPEDEEPVFTLSSEDMAAALNGGMPEAASEPPDSVAVTEPESDEAIGEADSPPASPAAPMAEAAAQPATRPGWPTQGATAWPVRLVTTVPNASPPRAILGLPDGREVVVNPGSMVPDFGIVVVAISPNSADLAKVAPAGDHATIESVTLTAQY